jgi:DNA-directed RNA polymerase specialized sigma24 family protein
MDDTKLLISIDAKLSALIALSALSLLGTEERSRVKPEAVLSNAGLDTSEIAKVLGKNLSAVRKSLQRAKK